MYRVTLRVVFFTCVLLGVFAFQAFAQEATVVGTVTDPAGSAIPNATITITATGTEQVRRLTSNDTGEFVAPDLHIGQYIVRVEAAGFKSVERSGVVLAVGDRSRIDVQMQIGDTKESINVEAAAIAVQTDSGEVSDVITGQQVSQLATNGRSLYSLAMLTPGASSYMSDFQSPTPVGG